jgi:hypothetical protein
LAISQTLDYAGLAAGCRARRGGCRHGSPRFPHKGRWLHRLDRKAIAGGHRQAPRARERNPEPVVQSRGSCAGNGPQVTEAPQGTDREAQSAARPRVEISPGEHDVPAFAPAFCCPVRGYRTHSKKLLPISRPVHLWGALYGSTLKLRTVAAPRQLGAKRCGQGRPGAAHPHLGVGSRQSAVRLPPAPPTPGQRGKGRLLPASTGSGWIAAFEGA